MLKRAKKERTQIMDKGMKVSINYVISIKAGIHQATLLHATVASNESPSVSLLRATYKRHAFDVSWQQSCVE